MGKDYLDVMNKILEIKEEDGFLISLDFVDEKEKIEKTKETEEIKEQLEKYFEGNLKEFNIKRKFLKGTEFQKKVWEAVFNIKYGETKSYKEIGKMIGNEKASRAVGLANNKNPLLIIIPCHRVIGSNGKLVGYRGGLDIKEKLLSLESKNKEMIFDIME
ncbi:MAG: methylated-DNA--[protein]-cysteine S-methyltransferase [Clostridium sp.]